MGWKSHNWANITKWPIIHKMVLNSMGCKFEKYYMKGNVLLQFGQEACKWNNVPTNTVFTRPKVITGDTFSLGLIQHASQLLLLLSTVSVEISAANAINTGLGYERDDNKLHTFYQNCYNKQILVEHITWKNLLGSFFLQKGDQYSVQDTWLQMINYNWKY